MMMVIMMVAVMVAVMTFYNVNLIFLSIGLAASLPAVSPPTFGSSYHARGNLKLPYAELDEPFEFYFDANNSRSHINFYHGNGTVIYYSCRSPGRSTILYYTVDVFYKFK